MWQVRLRGTSVVCLLSIPAEPVGVKTRELTPTATGPAAPLSAVPTLLLLYYISLKLDAVDTELVVSPLLLQRPTRAPALHGAVLCRLACSFLRGREDGAVRSYIATPPKKGGCPILLTRRGWLGSSSAVPAGPRSTVPHPATQPPPPPCW